MGVSRLTAYTIANRDDIVVSAGGPCENTGKYVGWITLGEEDRYRPLLNSEPIYDTAEAAKTAMQGVVDELRKTVAEELNGRDQILAIMEDANK